MFLSLFLVLALTFTFGSMAFAVAPAAGGTDTDAGGEEGAHDEGGEDASDAQDNREPADDEEDEADLPTADDIKAAVKRGDSKDSKDEKEPTGKKKKPAADEDNSEPEEKKAPSDAEDKGEDAGLDDALLKRAKEAGISPEKAKEIGSRKALETAIDLIYGQIAETGRSARTGGQPDPKQAPPAKKEEPPVKQGEAPQWPERIEKFNLDELTDEKGNKVNFKEEFPEAHSMLSKLQDHVNGHVERLHQAVTHLLNEHYTSQSEAMNSKFESAIAGLGEGYAEVLGKGSTEDLDEKSPAFEKRKAIVEKMGDLKRGFMQRTGRSPKFDTLFNEAASIVLAEFKQQLARKQAAQKLGDRQKQFSTRPSNQAPRNRQREEKAVDKLTEMLTEMADE